MVNEELLQALAEIKVSISEIATKFDSLEKRLNRNEGYIHHVNKRLLDTEKNVAWVKGAFYFLMASGIITLCSVAAQRIILSK